MRASGWHSRRRWERHRICAACVAVSPDLEPLEDRTLLSSSPVLFPSLSGHADSLVSLELAAFRTVRTNTFNQVGLYSVDSASGNTSDPDSSSISTGTGLYFASTDGALLQISSSDLPVQQTYTLRSLVFRIDGGSFDWLASSDALVVPSNAHPVRYSFTSNSSSGFSSSVRLQVEFPGGKVVSGIFDLSGSDLLSPDDRIDGDGLGESVFDSSVESEPVPTPVERLFVSDIPAGSTEDASSPALRDEKGNEDQLSRVTDVSLDVTIVRELVTSDWSDEVDTSLQRAMLSHQPEVVGSTALFIQPVSYNPSTPAGTSDSPPLVVSVSRTAKLPHDDFSSANSSDSIPTVVQPLLSAVGAVSAAIQSIAATVLSVFNGEISGEVFTTSARFAAPIDDRILSWSDSTNVGWTEKTGLLARFETVAWSAEPSRPFRVPGHGPAVVPVSGIPISEHLPEVDVAPAFGRLETTSDGQFVYHPDPGYVGTDSAILLVSDSLGRERRVPIVFVVSEHSEQSIAFQSDSDLLFSVGAELFEEFGR